MKLLTAADLAAMLTVEPPPVAKPPADKPLFLSPAQLRELTGRAQAPAQIDVLKRQGVPFWINAAGKPVVALSAFGGAPSTFKPEKSWEPRRGKAA